MVATPDLADVIIQAAAAGAKVILAGDTQQLQAVENGGGMSLLAAAHPHGWWSAFAASYTELRASTKERARKQLRLRQATTSCDRRS